MKESLVNLTISEDMVAPIVEKQLQAAVLAQLGNPEELIAKTVALALREKVNNQGEVSRYSYENTRDFVEVITVNAIHEAARTTLKAWLAENSQILKQKLIAELNKPGRRESIVAAFAEAAENAFRCSWSFQCNVQFKERE